MNRIKQLPVNLVNQIAAGEVIERPASVVKELVENSIDAGASRIEIMISNGCRNIRIADNGSGIHPDDINAAFQKHATSKLADEESLFHINTLGFRGEALASIISVAKVVCTTRTCGFEYGIKAFAENSIIRTEKTGCAQGTVFEVNELFYNQPARLKFLKGEKTEFSHIQELIQQLAAANPSIAFILKNGASCVINTSQNSDLLTRMTQIYSENIIKEIKEVDKLDEFTGMHISGYISTPDFTRSSRKSIYTFVNSRIVKCPVLSKAIDTAYRNMMPSGRYPLAVLNLEINPEDIDVNVHPQKREIRYKNTNQVFNFVQNAASSALVSAPADFQAFRDKTAFYKPHQENTFSSFQNFRQHRYEDEGGAETQNSFSFNFPLKMVKNEDKFEIESPKQQKAADIIKPYNSNRQEINVIGQFQNTYILVDNGDNLEFIDQHIAQERCIYEQLKRNKETASQLLIVSDVIDAAPADIELLEDAKPQLEKFGYKIERISDNQIVFKKIPQLLARISLQDLASDLIGALKDTDGSSLDLKEEKILITASCKAAVKAGEKLTLWQMEEIVRNLRNAENPYTCPHGRPISHKIPLKEVAAFFLRKA